MTACVLPILSVVEHQQMMLILSQVYLQMAKVVPMYIHQWSLVIWMGQQETHVHKEC